MNKKIGNKELFIILIALIGIYAIVRYIATKRGENTFHTAIIPKLDTNKLSDIYIYLHQKGTEDKPLHFFKKGGSLMVTQNGYTTLADENAEGFVVKLIQQISPDRLATNDPAQWKEFRVIDTMGTRVVLMGGKDTLVDMIVGKFGFNMQTRQGISYVRLHGQKEVYGVTGFLAMNITEDVDSWRDRKIIPLDDKTWSKVSFNYPGDSSFALSKDSNGAWLFSDGKKPDSVAVANNMSAMSRQNYGSFVYKFDTGSAKPLYSVTVERKGQSPVIINAYPADSVNKFVITSSMDPGAYFSGTKGGMFAGLFFNRDSFMHHAEPKKTAPPPMPHSMIKKQKK